MALKAHVGFSTPGISNVGPKIVSHFSKLGYRLVEEHPSEWRFSRGSKASALWRFDIRAYATELTVRTSADKSGSIWVSCDFNVWTFMNLLTGADVAQLEAEGRHLESSLRQGA